MRAILLAVPLLLPGSAFAHAILMESTPAPGGAVAAGPGKVVLHFNSRIDHARSRLVLRGTPDRVLPIGADSGVDALDAPIDLPPGDYTLRWQVLATDGHITRGDVPFTVRP